MNLNPQKDKKKPKDKIFLSLGLQILLTIATIAVVPQFWEFASNLLTSDKNQKIEEYKNELEKIKFMDSIISIERHKFTERSFIDQKLILEELETLSKILNDEHNITIFKAHDGGQPISTASFKYLTVMYSVANSPEIDILMDFQKRPISSGNSWLISNTISNDYTYIPDLNKERNYKGLAKDYCDSKGIKSFITFYIKSLTSSYFITVGFNKVHPTLRNENLFINILNTKERIKSLIYETPNHLKTIKYE